MVVLAFLLAAFAGVAAGEAAARASQKAYVTQPPGEWHPMAFNVTGTAVKYVIDHLGWDVIRTFGNVGIGDGSVRALNLSSNVNDINFTISNYMAGDITSAPWDPSRITDFSVQEEEHPEHEKNVSEAEASPEKKAPAGEQNETTAAVNKSGQEAGNASQVSFGNTGVNTALSDPFHTILLGRPVEDLLYEHPHGIPSYMYSRLVGLRVPGGSYANVGMRAIGYGY